MIKVAILWELGWNTPIKEADLWVYLLQEFGVSELIACPVSGIDKKKSMITEYQNLEDAIDFNQNMDVVWCHEKGESNLKDFEHPENALYIFGKTNYSPFLSMKNDDECSVKVETPNNQGLLWGHQAASIILYDRYIKEWQ